MKKFLAKFDEWIGTHIILDDTLHFIAGMLLTAVFYVVLLNIVDFDIDFNLVSALAFFSTLLVGCAKEIVIDGFIKKTEWSNRDMIANIVGSIVMVILMSVFKGMNIFVDMYVRETIMNNWLN